MQQREAERRKAEEVERAKQREKIRRRYKEQEASLANIEQTTKRYLIKNNKGCVHITCKFQHLLPLCLRIPCDLARSDSCQSML